MENYLPTIPEPHFYTNLLLVNFLIWVHIICQPFWLWFDWQAETKSVWKVMQHLTKATIKDPNSKMMTTGTTDFSLVSLIPSWVNPTNHQCLVRKPGGILPKCLYWPFCTSAGPRYEFRYSSLYLKLPRPHLGQ